MFVSHVDREYGWPCRYAGLLSSMYVDIDQSGAARFENLSSFLNALDDVGLAILVKERLGNANRGALNAVAKGRQKIVDGYVLRLDVVRIVSGDRRKPPRHVCNATRHHADGVGMDRQRESVGVRDPSH